LTRAGFGKDCPMEFLKFLLIILLFP